MSSEDLNELKANAARYLFLRNDATQKEQDIWLCHLPEDADAFCDSRMALRNLPAAPKPGESKEVV